MNRQLLEDLRALGQVQAPPRLLPRVLGALELGDDVLRRLGVLLNGELRPHARDELPGDAADVM
jgi:hypothetical protein